MPYYRICKNCGAYLDSNEKCTCDDVGKDQNKIDEIKNKIRIGHWIKRFGFDARIVFYICSVCGSNNGLTPSEFCQKCKSKMVENEKKIIF